MAACHLLTHIEQQGVVACFGDVDLCFEDMPLADFLLATLGRGDIDLLALAFTSTLRQLYTFFTGVELCQSVVVPQNAIALAGDQHGDGYLGVHLGETTGETANVAVAVLELSEAEEVFVLGGEEGKRGLALFQLMTGGGEDGLAGLVTDRQLLLLRIDAHRHVLLRYFVMLHVEPVWQVALHGIALRVLDAHGIAGKRRNGETPLSEGRLCRYVQTECHQPCKGS